MPKIIHFEDDTFLGAMYKTKFEMKGFKYLHFKYPPEDLVDMVKREKPDLIIMDIIMPKMDGFEATKLLKSNQETKNFPIFGLCNMGQKKDIDEALSAGMEKYFVTADHMPSEIVDEVKKALGMPVSLSSKKRIPPPSQAWHGSSVQEQLKRESEPQKKS